MLKYEVAKGLFEEIREKMEKQADEELKEFYGEFLQSAAEYAKRRLAWSFMDREAQIADDKSRSIKHDAYMAMLSAVCRNLGIEGVDELMPDRKVKGDFACYIALFLALEQR